MIIDRDIQIPDAALAAELRRELRRQQIVTAALVRIHDAITALQPHTPRRKRLDEPVSREEDRQAYAGTMLRLQEYCEAREMSYPLTLKRMAEIVMGQLDVEPFGELTGPIDSVLGEITRRAGRVETEPVAVGGGSHA